MIFSGKLYAECDGVFYMTEDTFNDRPVYARDLDTNQTRYIYAGTTRWLCSFAIGNESYFTTGPPLAFKYPYGTWMYNLKYVSAASGK